MSHLDVLVNADCAECHASVANQSCRPFQTYKSRCVSDRAYVSGGGFTLIVSQHCQYTVLHYSQAGLCLVVSTEGRCGLAYGFPCKLTSQSQQTPIA